MLDLEMLELAGGGFVLAVDGFDVAGHAFAYRINHQVHFPFGTFQNQFNPAIGHVADKSAHIMLDCDILNGVSETHPLHSAAEVAVLAAARRNASSKR